MDTNLATDAEVLARIETFRATYGMAETSFGRAAIGDPNLISNLRAGRSLTLKTANAVVAFMASYTPTQDAA